MSNPPLTRPVVGSQRTGAAAFTRAEWELVVRLPGRVVVAATLAGPEATRGSVVSGLAGIDAVAGGLGSASRLVRDVVSAIYLEDSANSLEEGPPDGLAAEVRDGLSAEVGYASGDPERDRVDAISGVLRACAAVAELLRTRVGPEDVDAYRYWLDAIASRVCRAARTGGPFGPGAAVTDVGERQFLAALDAAFQR